MAKLLIIMVSLSTISLVCGQNGDNTGSEPVEGLPPIPLPPIDSDNLQENVENDQTSTSGSSSNMESTWSPGRIAQIVIAVIESALLTLVLLFPTLMDPVVAFINRYIGGASSRRRRDVRQAMMEHATSLHNLVLDAIDKFEEMDSMLSLYT
ncbi:hypothetical protein SK128_011608 [Halocaridina rubra]|uniref:Uncharacterized protein n=1 Tax=Halocaridina rubra TaxID=373956 RepID=A0AAN9A4H9_HALRR